jgi:hypothetical protein
MVSIFVMEINVNHWSCRAISHLRLITVLDNHAEYFCILIAESISINGNSGNGNQ